MTKVIKKKKSHVEIRVKHGLSYKTKKVELDREYSNEELLDIRCRLTRAKFCWFF